MAPRTSSERRGSGECAAPGDRVGGGGGVWLVQGDRKPKHGTAPESREDAHLLWGVSCVTGMDNMYLSPQHRHLLAANGQAKTRATTSPRPLQLHLHALV